MITGLGILSIISGVMLHVAISHMDDITAYIRNKARYASEFEIKHPYTYTSYGIGNDEIESF